MRPRRKTQTSAEVVYLVNASRLGGSRRSDGHPNPGPVGSHRVGRRILGDDGANDGARVPFSSVQPDREVGKRQFLPRLAEWEPTHVGHPATPSPKGKASPGILTQQLLGRVGRMMDCDPDPGVSTRDPAGRRVLANNEPHHGRGSSFQPAYLHVEP